MQQQTPLDLASNLFNKQATVPHFSVQNPTSYLVYEQALALYDAGFNVMPVKPRAKHGYSGWGKLHYQRLTRKYLEILLDTIPDRPNIAINVGRSSGNLVVLDCETSERFMEVSRILSEANIGLFAVCSGGKKGGGHFYIRSDQEIRNLKAGIIYDDMEVRGSNCFVLAPESIHPDTGILYKWWEGNNTPAPPHVSLADLQKIFPQISSTKKAKVSKSSVEYSPLSRTTQDYLANGHSLPESNRNNRLFAAACDYAGNNYSDSDAYNDLEPIARNSGLSAREIHQTIDSAYSRSRTPARQISIKDNPKSKTKLSIVERVINWTYSQNWKTEKIKATTAHHVMRALAERAKIAYAQDTNIFRACHREIAELARVSRQSVNKTLKCFIKAKGILEYRGKDKNSEAYLYAFVEEKLVSESSTLALTGKVNSVLFSDTDLLETGGLGKTAYDVWKRLLECEKPIKRGDLAALCCISPSSTSNALNKLQDLNLAVVENHLWSGISENEDELAIELGVKGKGERRVEQHNDERANWAYMALLEGIKKFHKLNQEEVTHD